VLRLQPELTLVPGFMVEAFAVVPNGAWPGSMHPYYDVDYPAVEAYMKDEPGVLEAHLAAAPEAKDKKQEIEGRQGKRKDAKEVQ
jgi:glutaconate CoA-transferase subunit A